MAGTKPLTAAVWVVRRTATMSLTLYHAGNSIQTPNLPIQCKSLTNIAKAYGHVDGRGTVTTAPHLALLSPDRLCMKINIQCLYLLGSPL